MIERFQHVHSDPSNSAEFFQNLCDQTNCNPDARVPLYAHPSARYFLEILSNRFHVGLRHRSQFHQSVEVIFKPYFQLHLMGGIMHVQMRSFLCAWLGPAD